LSITGWRKEYQCLSITILQPIFDDFSHDKNLEKMVIKGKTNKPQNQ
jgi:hypothetical protein